MKSSNLLRDPYEMNVEILRAWSTYITVSVLNHIYYREYNLNNWVKYIINFSYKIVKVRFINLVNCVISFSYKTVTIRFTNLVYSIINFC